MEETIRIDDVGNAEQVLVRLIHERKSLESAQQVLMTYRAVSTRLESATGELKGLEREITLAKEMLAGVEADVGAMMKKVDGQVSAYREKQLANAQEEIDLVGEQLESVKKEYKVFTDTMAEEVKKYNVKKGEMDRELAGVMDELIEARREHAVLAEAMGKAASFFKMS